MPSPPLPPHDDPGRPSARILFVDDEPLVLRALKRVLFRYVDDWEMAFAESGAEALEILASAEHDVIITDMRMPGMDGAELLAEVVARHPATARVVLTGHTELSAALRALPLAHQLLAKPSDPRQLVDTLATLRRLVRLVPHRRARKLVGRVTALPSRPEVLASLRCAGPAAGVEGLTALVARDLGASAKLLQVVNTEYLGVGRMVFRPEDAVSGLGATMVDELVRAPGFLAPYEPAEDSTFSLAARCRHARDTARLAEALAPPPLRDAASLAGLLHDVGDLVYALQAPALLAPIARDAGTIGSRSARERAALGCTHAELGGYLLGLWGFPAPIVEAVSAHHTPLGEDGGADAAAAPSGAGQQLAAIVRLADALTHAVTGEATLAELVEPALWRAVAPDATADGLVDLAHRHLEPSP